MSLTRDYPETKVRRIREQIPHPIVDADGHLIEFWPLLADYIREQGVEPKLERMAMSYRSFDQTTLEDRALMEYGTPFAVLEEQQRVDLYRRQTRGDFRHDVSSDERETRLRLYSTDAAYRILRPGIAALIAAYWAFCLLAPFAKQRITLLITAVVFTWIAVAIIALPTLIRSWTEPDDPGEPRLVPGATHN